MKARVWRLPAYIAVLIIIVTVVLSCSEKPDAIGIDLVDDSKAIVNFDTTFNLNVYSKIEDSIQTDETSINLIGSTYSETFGRTNASVYSQIRISSLTPVWGDNPVVDSVIFSMLYTGYYGNVNTEQTFRMYRVLEDMHWDSAYFSHNSFETSDVEMAVHTFVPDLTEVPVIDSTGEEPDTTYEMPDLRIPVDESFGYEMFNLDTSHTSSSDAFLDYFKGIYLRPDDVNSAGEGAVLYFDLLDNRSEMTIYYHNDTTDSLSFNFFVNLNNARVGKYEHEYLLSTDQNFLDMVLNGDTTLGSDNLYLQAMGGVKTEISFPDIESWAGTSSRVINEAKLIINLESEHDEDYPASTSLILFKNLENGRYDFVPDQLQGESYFSGTYIESSNSYLFRISLHVQDLLAGEPDYGLGLFPTGKSIKGTEMKLYGTDINNPNRFQLQVTYTDVD